MYNSVIKHSFTNYPSTKSFIFSVTRSDTSSLTRVFLSVSALFSVKNEGRCCKDFVSLQTSSFLICPFSSLNSALPIVHTNAVMANEANRLPKMLLKEVVQSPRFLKALTLSNAECIRQKLKTYSAEIKVSTDYEKISLKTSFHCLTGSILHDD